MAVRPLSRITALVGVTVLAFATLVAVPGAASAEPVGSGGVYTRTGTISNVGAPGSTVKVQVWAGDDTDGWGVTQEETVAAVNGTYTYSLDLSTVGGVLLKFVSSDTSEVPVVWPQPWIGYRVQDALNFGATLVSTVTGQVDATFPKSHGLGGTVRDHDGLPLYGAGVSIYTATGLELTGMIASIQTAGYNFVVPAGTYRLGYVYQNHYSQFYQGVDTDNPLAAGVSTITVTDDGEPGAIDSAMNEIPSYQLSGTVTAGGIHNGLVATLYQVIDGVVQAGTGTDVNPTNGHYSFDVQPGNYKLGFSDSLGGFATIFNGGIVTTDAANPHIPVISVTNGAHLVNATLPSAAFTTTPKPTISGSAALGHVLTASDASWTPAATVSYRWLRNGVAISGATHPTYTVTTADLGTALTVSATGTYRGRASTSVVSTAVHVALGTLTTAKPKISGKPKVGHTLTGKPGTWTTGTTFTYQWYAGGKAIAKATHATLRLASSAKGKKITVKVTGKKSGYVTASRTSSATVRVAE